MPNACRMPHAACAIGACRAAQMVSGYSLGNVKVLNVAHLWAIIVAHM
jgi:hypothetical protein